MNAFETRQGASGLELWCEDVALGALAEAVGTPLYVYSSAALVARFTAFRDAFDPAPALVAYAVKANPSLAVLRTLARLGAGADTVSEGEIRRALAAGVDAEAIVFSGVGKTAAELAFALDVGVGAINVESEPELRLVSRIARERGARAPIALRVNPDVAAGGHAKISTGRSASKFGVGFDEVEALYARASGDPALDPLGLACHIGSQIERLEPLAAAFRRLRELTERLRARGCAVRRLDLGGGLGVRYAQEDDLPTPADLADLVARVFGGLGVELAFEPGRAIVAEAGALVSTVLHEHARASGPRFLVLDAGMNDLVRPAMYDAHHALAVVRRAAQDGDEVVYDVVGPVCETSDTFARARRAPRLARGDVVALLAAGAYGASMASEYNSRPLVPEVLVHGDRWAITRPRPSYDDMLARERSAAWL